LIEKAKAQRIHLFFLDAAHFVYRPFLGFLYSFTTLFVKASAGRKRYNVLGALNAITKEIVTFSNFSYINSHSVCELMDKLTTHYRGLPIFIVLDNARYQKNEFVKAYAEYLNIQLVFLPPYSPNLNLIERLWRFIKKEALYSTYYENFSDFTQAIDQCLEDTKGKYKSELESLLSLNFQSFKNATIIP
jgi:transposase